MKGGRRALLTGAVVGFLVLLLVGGALAKLAADLLWYRSLQLEDVYWTRFRATIAVRGTVALLVAAAVFGNLLVVSKTLGGIQLRRRYANIEIAERVPRGYILSVIAGIALFSAWWLSSAVGDPISVLSAFGPELWGQADPVFGLDPAYYVFQWPVLRRFQTLAGLVVFWIALLSTSLYVATGAIKAVNGRPVVGTLARRHLGMLAATFLLLYAISIWLSRYGLVIDGNGFGGGLGYTDVHARLPAKLLLSGLALVCAGVVAHGSWVGELRMALFSLALLTVGWMVGERAYPALVQRISVEPNELPREEPFIRDHMEFTRLGYGVGDVQQVPLPYDANAPLDEAVLVERLRGVPLWDPRPLLTTYRQRQGLFRRYTFTSVHHDRYATSNGLEPVALAVRELETSELEEAAETWQNLHLTYVASEGAVASPVARMAGDGTPIFYLWDIDPPKIAPDAPPGLALDDASVYFGERTTEYVVVDQSAPPVGVALDAWWKKLLFGWAFQSKNLLLSGDITRGSKLVYQRQVLERVQEIAPFLAFAADGGVQPVLAEGRIVWLVDGYTTSSTFPLSPLLGLDGRGVRYVRNSVKATVDAISGEVRLYGLLTDDPILRTYSRHFPGLVRPVAEMPESLRSHLRYPIGLMALQATVLGAYHLDDAREFYEQQDVWSLATEQYQATPVTMLPTYSMFALPGSDETEFLLSVPLVPGGRQNMTAFMVTRNDPPNYGEQILYMLPRDEVVFGPQQIEAMIDQDPEISQELALWRRGGSDVTRGHMMIVPVDGGLVYVEPLFLEAANAAIPQLERVILARSGRVAMGSTFESAVAGLMRGPGSAAEGAAGVNAASASASAAPAPGALDAARRLMNQADASLRAGDWTGFGRSWQELRDLLDAPPGYP